jgi:hypothetical protein
MPVFQQGPTDHDERTGYGSSCPRSSPPAPLRMELVPSARHDITQSSCSRLRVCLSYRLFAQQTLGAYLLPGDGRHISKQLAERLTACREIALLLEGEQHEWHHALINSRRRDPRVYSPGNIVFACRATRSNAARGRVGKLEYAFTGPWHVTASLHGRSYSLEHCHNTARKEKKHAADLAPYPAELIPFEPLDGADTRYGQLYKPIGANPFKEAGIKGFIPPSPFKVPVNFIDIGDVAVFPWPTLAELIDDIEPFPWRNNEEHRQILSDDDPFSPAVMYTRPPPSLPLPAEPTNPSSPSITTLAPLIISSTDKLFFIAHKIGTANCYEWRLVRVMFQDSVSLYPPCLQDGRFLVKFYMAHPADARYNAINQCYWLQYRDHNSPSHIRHYGCAFDHTVGYFCGMRLTPSPSHCPELGESHSWRHIHPWAF